MPVAHYLHQEQRNEDYRYHILCCLQSMNRWREFFADRIGNYDLCMRQSRWRF